MARPIAISLTLCLWTGGAATADTWFVQPFAELSKTAESARVSRVVFLSDVDVWRSQVHHALAGGSDSGALLALENFISALIKERDGALKHHHQAASSLLKIEKLKGELAQAHLKYGEISRRLSHNRPSADSHGPEVKILVQPAVTQATSEKRETQERWIVEFASGGSGKSDETDVMKQMTRANIKLDNESGALETLETLAATLRERRDRLAKSHGQEAERLAALTQLQDALGRAHLDCGLLGQVIHARSEVARVAAEATAGRATQADLAAARDRLADAEARMAAEGILCGR